MSAEAVDWSETLRRRRADLGWSLAELASRTGLSRAYLSALERGRTKRPGAETMRRLQAAIGPLLDAPETVEAPDGLTAFAAERGLDATEIAPLAALRVRGRAPQTKERWAFIYQALLASESIDADPTYQAANIRDRPSRNE